MGLKFGDGVVDTAGMKPSCAVLSNSCLAVCQLCPWFCLRHFHYLYITVPCVHA